jgi:hypothetical protein
MIGVLVLMGATFVSLGAGAVRAGAAGVATNDPGIGSAEALANPKCDPNTKRVKYQSYSAPLCVKPWKAGADNGGATAQGVTKDSIKVVALVPPAISQQQLDTKGLYVNQATGQNSPTAIVDSTKDQNEMMKYAYETWGRTVEFDYVKSSGNDETAQRADAVAVAALKPFGVLDMASSVGTPALGGGVVFEQALQNAGVPFVFGALATVGRDPKVASHVWGTPVAEFIGKQLAGGKAIYADKSMQGQPRKFGILFPNTFDIDDFKSQLKKYGVTIASDAMYTIPPGQVSAQSSSPEIDAQITPLVTRLKAAGVNNLIMMTTHSVATTASKSMKSQEWFPEVTVTSYPYQDLDILARANDQEVWSHAFGLVWFLPSVAGGIPQQDVQTFQWFWGTDVGTRWVGGVSQLGALYSAIQFAGPKLTKANVDAVSARLRKANAGVGGAYSNSALTFEVPPPPAPGEVATRGTALAWWNPDIQGPGNFNLGAQGKGEYMYLDQGKRYVPGSYPKAKKKFFDPKNGTAEFPAAPASEPKWPTYPCENCPSTGNTSITPAASA